MNRPCTPRAAFAPHLLRWLVAGIGLLPLAGCAAFNGSAASLTCPNEAIAPDLDSIAQFGTATGRTLNDVQGAGKIRSVNVDCSAVKGGGISDKLTITIAAVRSNPKLRTVTFPYFVAVADVSGNILVKRNFTVTIPFVGDQNFVQAVERITTDVPVRSIELGNSYTTVVGFQLTADELAFNRAHKPQ